jgi:hypothetical protein
MRLLTPSCLFFCPSVCPETTQLSLAGFWRNLIFEFFFFENLSRTFKFHSNLTRIMGTLQKTFSHLWQHLAEFFLQWEMFQTKVVEILKTTHSMSNSVSRKLCRSWDNMEKYDGARKATDDKTTYNKRFACWITKGTYALRLCDINCFCAATMFLRKRPTVTL